MNFYATFSIPFIVGVVTMFVVLIVKYGSWIFGLSAADRMRIVKGIPSRQTPRRLPHPLPKRPELPERL